MKNESQLYKLKDKALYFPQSFPVGHLQKVLDCTKQALTSDSLNLKYFEIALHGVRDLNKPLILNIKLRCVTHSSPFVLYRHSRCLKLAGLSWRGVLSLLLFEMQIILLCWNLKNKGSLLALKVP